MLPTAKVNCFIFACSHPSSVKKVRRTKPKYIYVHQDGTSNVGLQISVTPYLSFGGRNKTNLIEAFVMDIWNSYFSHNGWNSARGWCVGR